MPELLIDRVEAVAIITLNRPGRHNALTPDLYDEIEEAVSGLIADDTVQCLVFAGSGKSFCGGFDLQVETTQSEADDPWIQWQALQAERRIHKLIWDSPKPTVCEAKGYCLGGGMLFMNLCDLVVAARDAVFGEPEITFSLMPQPKLLYYIPLRQAKEIMMLGERFSAEEGLRVGLVNRVVDLDLLRPTVLAMAKRLASMPRETMQMTKRIINAAMRAQGHDLMEEWGWDDFLLSTMVPTSQRQRFLRTVKRDGVKAALREVQQHDIPFEGHKL